MSKEGYQPLKTKTTKIIPPNTSSNVKKKDGYTWKDLDKAWWEGFDTCKKKAGEANVKLNDELEKLKKQLEELPDKWCRNEEDYCPYLEKLEKENEEMAKEYAIGRTYPKFETDYIANFVLHEVEGAYLAGLKAGKDMNVATKWHKVADGYLPEENRTVLDEAGDRFYYFRGHFYYESDSRFDCQPIAWCEIPKYTKE